MGNEMDEPNVIGSIMGTATYDVVKLRNYNDKQLGTEIIGKYNGSETNYHTETDRIFIGGIQLKQLSEKMVLEPTDGFIWVEATEDELHITEERP